MTDWKLVFAGGAIGILGMGAGAWLFGSPRAEAQQGPFTQCIIARQESLDTNNQGQIETPRIDRTIRIPSGWTPIGGGGLVGEWVGTVIVCR